MVANNTTLPIAILVGLTNKGHMKPIIINKTFEDIIDENSCRYPLGNLLDSYKYFCGHERYGNLPYCKVHFKLCENKKALDISKKN